MTGTVGELSDGFYVEDTGVGLPDQKRFFEAGASTIEMGAGIGLRVVKQIVDAHEWEITATAGIDGSVRFEITNVDFSNE